MPATFTDIEVKCVTALLVESVDVTKQIDHKIVKKTDTTFDSGTKFDPTFEFSVKGRGSAADSLLGTSSSTYIPDQITTGVTLIKSVKNTEVNDDYNSFEVSGVNYPGAS